MAWSIGGGAAEYQSASNNNSSITAWCDIGWSSYDSYAGYNTSGIIQIDGANYGYTGPTSINYVSYYPYYGSASGAVRVGEKNVAWTHDNDTGYRGAKATHVYFYGGGGYAPGDLNYNTPDFGAVDYNRSAIQITSGPSVSRNASANILYYSTYDPGAYNNGTQRDFDWNYYYPGIGWTDLSNTADPSGSVSVDPHTTYYIRAIAYNGDGNNGWSPSSAASYGIPNTPQSTSATRSTSVAGRISVSWAAPPYVGGGIDYYHVYRNSAYLGQYTSTSINDDGLSRGTTYTYNIYAHNSSGWTPTPSAASAVAPGVPGAPSSISLASKVGRTLTISHAQDSNGYGNNVTEYRMQLSTDNGVIWKGWDNTSKTFTATNTYNVTSSGSFTYQLLTPALTYKWRVQAVNSIGVGDAQTIATGTFVGAGGKRYDPSANGGLGGWQPTVTSKRYDPAANSGSGGWVDFTTAKRYDSSANGGLGGWVDLT